MGAYKEISVEAGESGSGGEEEISALVLYPGRAELSTPIIEVVRRPEIRNRLVQLKAWVDEKAARAMALPCTEETMQIVKDARADIRRVREDLDKQRKEAKAAILEPWNVLEKAFKECAIDALDAADNDLKKKINATEGAIKCRCEARMREYFAEMCAAAHVDFVRFDQMGMKISLSDARSVEARRLKEQIAVWVAGISEAVHHISKLPDAEEIMVEYKKTLDAARAIAAVKERHQQIEAEKQKAAQLAEVLERESEAVARVEEAAPPVVLTAEPQKLLKAVFTARGTKEQLIRLREFMKSEGINYEC